MSYKLYQGDCLEIMPLLEDKSVDMILCDLPYGTTACKWDTIIPFEPLWNEYERIIKRGGAIVLTASQPFTSILVNSNLKWFRYEWIWKKTRKTGFPNANKQPLRNYEDVLVFYNEQCTYNPQNLVSKKPTVVHRNKPTRDTVNSGENDGSLCGSYIQYYENYPSQIISFDNEGNTFHPTQKPVKLFEYLIKTYTNEGDLVLDNCAGSGTTGVAASNLNRDSILIEQEPEYCEIIRKRMKETEALRVEQRKQKTLMDFEGQTKLKV